MTFRKTVEQIHKELISPFFKDMQEVKFFKELGLAVFIGLVGVTGFYGYRWYQAGGQGQAQQVFAECMEEFQKAVSSKTTDAWLNVDMVAKLGHEQHGSSKYGPYFLALRAHAAMQQGKTTQALQVMEQAIQTMSKSDPLILLYKTKFALMKLDDTDTATQKEGLSELQKLAADTNNVNRDAALYYIGSFHWVHNELDMAKQYWNKLLELTSGEHKSPWAMQAEQLLQQVV